ncbi:S9 family peptidase [Pseudoteredinibacter isoporae]|uniref:Dipeptidyl aminopeptidase/acylaminoacyl peptidase n=1 Tax=Pseudoteredinibacter isoporae TaxID=570281 RepID=A0A7X0JU23_9GAMM|nr:S9 family peptidase [Pseudoteredinibacter isoporae]MBB6521440.1 dipeptidyl aminopeptidase/acylaminoacyl peptidase [Pseudoteredinibacter isoporae]NHO86994.1 S9 family peptidase [Pseudoteredinibacter isoporae]NIB24553.1 S9 family peptidase [Pseudoteredinibacter isoporae]
MTHSNHKIAAPCGSWASPISASLLVADSVRLSEPRVHEDYNYWLEGRPQEKGRSVLVRAPQHNPEQTEDLSPSPFSVRSACHEYGGASYCIAGNAVFFVNAKDQDIYRLCLTSKDIERITKLEHTRFADLLWDAQRQRLIAVSEDHARCDEGHEPENTIVSIDIAGAPDARTTTLFSGADFYSNPCLSPDGKNLSYLCWHHPNMPWDATECYVVQLDDQGGVKNQRRVSAIDTPTLEAQQESIFQPSFGPDGNLYFVSDCSDWWNLYRYSLDTEKLDALQPMEAEFATPQWVFGMSCYGFLNNNTIACCYTQDGRWQLGELDIDTKTLKNIESPYDDISMINCAEGRALFFAANSQSASQLCQWQNQTIRQVCTSSSSDIEPEYISAPQALSFAAGGETAHGFYYAPCNPEYQAMPDEKAPLIALCHGGPTGATETALSVKIQFWTSRGFAVFDINYRGSTGYGRPYRDSLKGQWGIKDVEDVCAGAQFLVDKGLADPERLCIKGGSAGGYTVLAALTFAETFAAGASHYGIGDLETLARDTHKFEARYLDSMVGPYPGAKEIYQQRSPINHVEQLNCPAIFFQGLEDKVVPPNQAEAMLEALNNKKLPVAYVPFEGEGHGFRGAEAIVTALEGELYFYSRLFDFNAPDLEADSINAVNILNLETN